MKGHKFGPLPCPKCGKVHIHGPTGNKWSEEARRRFSLIRKENPPSREMIEAARKHNLGRKRPEITGDQNPNRRPEVREAKRQLWKDQEFIRKQLVARRGVPQNKAEKKLQDLLDQNFPDQWRFTGTGQFLVRTSEGWKKPDFIHNTRKLIIELFGRYWHTDSEVETRTKLFEELGYQTLVIWDDELDKIDSVLLKIRSLIGIV